MIGDYRHPTARLPGAGGAPEIAAWAGEVIVGARHSRRTFMERCDFVTSVGYGHSGDDRGRSTLPGRGPTTIVTDLGLLRPDPTTGELVLVATHPGVRIDDVRDATGWQLQVTADVAVTEPPTTDELTALRTLSTARP